MLQVAVCCGTNMLQVKINVKHVTMVISQLSLLTKNQRNKETCLELGHDIFQLCIVDFDLQNEYF